jgi:tetratricopeptide (TPR) repeat protein
VSVRLRVVDYQDPDHWRWLLQDPDGNFVADHQVALDPIEAEYLAFVDLAGFLRYRAEPDRRIASEAELVERVGRWVGRQVLGESIGRALVDASPVVVDVVLPEDADFLLYRPLELAHVHGMPLARQDVSLVFQVEGEARPAAKAPIEGRLRLLAVFSLPTEGTALALRRERYGLVRLVRSIATRYRRAIEVHVLQYGVTRQRLGEALRAGAGWDVVHFSGHGLADGLVLEHPDGTGDPVHTPELVALLRPARQRLKLIVLSSCLSAAATAAETRRWLQLVVPDQLQAEAKASATARPLPGLARELVARLGCGVLAMRFPVVDDFAIALDEYLYEGLLGQEQPLARALQLAIPQTTGEQASVGAPALSVATPALFGPVAADLRFSPPPGEPDFNVNTSKTAFFPDEPVRFVGRVGVLTEASMVLAPRNREGRNAVVLQATTSQTELARFLPRLTQLLEDQAILLVLDNLESLLTDQGAWRDPAWEQLVHALINHSGESRVVLTSRIRPQGLDGRVLVEAIHVLKLDEALLLARELPHLSRLLRQDPAVQPSGEQTGGQAGVASGVGLVRRVLQVVQGHPKLLELADAQAANPQLLKARLAEVEQALPDADRLGVFFATGESELVPEQFLQTLAGWTRGVAGVLPEGARVLLGVVCALEEPDRTKPILQAVWPHVWERLGHQGDPPPLPETMAVLEREALVHAEQPAGRRQSGDGLVDYRVHPGVAEAVRAQTTPQLQQTVDTELAAYWQAVFGQALKVKGGEASGVVVHAGRAAAPYLFRRRDWVIASRLLEQVFRRDRSPATVQALLPLLRQIAQATRGSDRELIDVSVLVRAMAEVQPEEAEPQLRELLKRAVAQERFDLASVAAGDLANLLGVSGRLAEALALIEQKADYTRRAGFGRWTQLADQGRRLQLLQRMGRDEDVLAEVEALQDELTTLPESSEQEERVPPWNVRETTLTTGTLAAQALERWETALALNQEVANSKLARGASPLDLAETRYNDYSPLLRLGRIDQAQALLVACRQLFEAERYVAGLGKVFTALAVIESLLGRYEDAIGLEQAALRYKYIEADPDTVGVSHFNLATYLLRAGRDQATVLAHRLARGLLEYQMGSGGLPKTLPVLAGDLEALADRAPVPTSFAALCQQVQQVEGVRFGELFARLPGPAADGDEALAAVLRLARDLPAAPAAPAHEGG